MTEKELAKQIFTDTGNTLLYLAAALLGATVVLGFCIWMFRREQFAGFKKSALGLWVGFAIAVIVTMTYLSFKYNAFDQDLSHDLVRAYLFKPLLAMVLIALIGGVLMYVASFFNRTAVKLAGIATLLGETAGFVAAMVLMTRYYKENPGTEWLPNMNTTALIASAIVVMAVIAVIYMLGGVSFGRKNQIEKRRESGDTRSLVYGAIAIAMAFALSYLKMFEMPQGGAVTFASLLPLMVYCCMFGTRKGVVVCLIYGVLQAIQDPWIIHPMQFLLDYPLAFGVVGVSGIFVEKGVFKNKKVLGFLLGGIVAVALRYACHVCSGIFAFADYADLDKYSTALAYSFGYNSFCFVDMLIALVAGSVLFASKSFVAQMDRAKTQQAGLSETDFSDDDEDDSYAIEIGDES